MAGQRFSAGGGVVRRDDEARASKLGNILLHSQKLMKTDFCGTFGAARP